MSNCERLDEVITYALHQLTPAEAAEIRTHIAGCAACQLKLCEFQEMIGLLGLAASPATPPAGLRRAVLDRVAAEASSSPRSQGRRLALRRWGTPIWAAAVVAALAVGLYALMRVEGLQQRIAGFQQATRLEQAYAMVGVSKEMPGAAARVVVVREGAGTRVTIEGQGLRPLPPGQVYQLWLIKDGKRLSGGVFVVDGEGRGGGTAWLSGEVAFDALGVTQEPDAFGDKPRGPKVLGSA